MSGVGGSEQGEVAGAPPGPARSGGLDVGCAPKRAAAARVWLPLLAKAPGPKSPFLVVDGSGHVFVHDRGRRRRVNNALLAAALESILGPPRRVSRRRIDAWPEGAPVEVLEGPKGDVVVVVGGRRFPVVGLPLPHPVRQRVLDRIPIGDPLDLRRALVPRAEVEAVEQRARLLAESASLSGIRRRVRQRIAQKGVLGTLVEVRRRLVAELRQSIARRLLY